MALRPLDNALPTTPERPKKVAKIAISTRKPSSDLGVNDENKAPPAATGDLAVDYIASKDLKALPEPETKIQVTSFLFLPERSLIRSFSHSILNCFRG
uniref:Uncharacterized protein n=1 Tax=Nelumbo nucifera TaxID=4432 RepID=A0A822YPP4_NELNU|nr:TPA_asm: hypothetical protein HUJ06_012160 [Nelumbo nucifera]